MQSETNDGSSDVHMYVVRAGSQDELNYHWKLPIFIQSINRNDSSLEVLN